MVRGHHGSRSGQFLDIPLANGYLSPATTTHITSHHVKPVHLNGGPNGVPPGLRLSTTSREDTTRLRLQEQREQQFASSYQHHAVIGLSGEKIPGFRTSAAFFASLRTNLRLNASPPPSPWSTPPALRASGTSLPPPSPLSTAMDSATEADEKEKVDDPMAGVPELKSYVTNDEGEKVAALKLVADSVAQMGQAANSSLISHPLNLAILVAILSLTARWMIDRGTEPSLVGSTAAGVIVIALAVCRYLTRGYIFAAEEIDWDWLGAADVIITKFGDEVIGTAIIDWVSTSDTRQKRKKAWRGEIKAWTVRLKYRQKGVGAALLDEAVKESRKKGAETIEFADEHANSKRVLPSLYNRKFDEREQRARELLRDLLESSPGKWKRKRGGSN